MRQANAAACPSHAFRIRMAASPARPRSNWGGGWRCSHNPNLALAEAALREAQRNGKLATYGSPKVPTRFSCPVVTCKSPAEDQPRWFWLAISFPRPSGRERSPFRARWPRIGRRGKRDNVSQIPHRRGWAFNRFPFPLDAPGNLARKIVDSVTGASFSVHASTIPWVVGHWLSHTRNVGCTQAPSTRHEAMTLSAAAS